MLGETLLSSLDLVRVQHLEDLSQHEGWGARSSEKGSWEAASYGDEVKGKWDHQTDSSEWGGWDSQRREGQLTAEMGLSRRWEEWSEANRGFYQEPTGTWEETGWWLLKLLSQCGHSLWSFWGAKFSPLCGHVLLLSSLMMDFPPFPSFGAMEHGSLEVT